MGDDAAILNFGDKDVLVTTDLLLEGIHFDLRYVPLKHLGYKAAIVNFSDVYAMNGTPRQITVSLGVSSRFTVEHLEALYSGIRLARESYGVDLGRRHKRIGDRSCDQHNLHRRCQQGGCRDPHRREAHRHHLA